MAYVDVQIFGTFNMSKILSRTVNTLLLSGFLNNLNASSTQFGLNEYHNNHSSSQKYSENIVEKSKNLVEFLFKRQGEILGSMKKKFEASDKSKLQKKDLSRCEELLKISTNSYRDIINFKIQYEKYLNNQDYNYEILLTTFFTGLISSHNKYCEQAIFDLKSTDRFNAHYDYFINPYDEGISFISDRLINLYNKHMSKNIIISQINFVGVVGVSGIFNICLDNKFGFISTLDRGFVVSQISKLAQSNLSVATPRHLMSKDKNQTVFLFYQKFLIKNDCYIVSRLKIVEGLGQGTENLAVSFLKGFHHKYPFTLPRKELSIPLTPKINMNLAKFASIAVNALEDVDYLLRTADKKIVLPIPMAEDKDYMGLLFLEQLEEEAKKDSATCLYLLSNIHDENLPLLGEGETHDLNLPVDLIKGTNNTTTIKIDSITDPNELNYQYPEMKSKDLQAIVATMRQDAEQDLIAQEAARFVESLPDDHPIFDHVLSALSDNVATMQTAGQTDLPQGEGDRVLEGGVLDNKSENNLDNNAERSKSPDLTAAQNLDEIRRLEKEEYKAQRRAELKKAKYWESLAQSKDKLTKAECDILQEAKEKIEYKKTLFKYMTQSQINKEAKKLKATVDFKSSSHGYVTLNYINPDTKAKIEKKIHLSTHLDKGHKKIANMGAHVYGHRYRNLNATLNVKN